MFATLLGALPRPVGSDPATDDQAVVAAIRAQEAAGLEPITDGRLRGEPGDRLPDSPAIVDAWRFATAQTDRAVKQALPGPYSLGRRLVAAEAAGKARRDDTGKRADATQRSADTLRSIIGELAAAGCPLIEVEETEAHLIGDDPLERALFREAHQRLIQGVVTTHMTLSIVGGSAWGAGLETVLAAPYASLAVDLIAGPDNWNLVTRLPGDRGVIVGALPAKDSPADASETLLWAARHAAASRARGLDRVGIGSAGSFANLTWEAAIAKLQRLGDAARLASMPAGDEQLRQLDPRSINARTAAMGHGQAPRRKDS